MQEEGQWWSYLTTDKRRCLKRLLNKHPDVAQAFDVCLPWPALFSSMYVDVLHKLLARRCYGVSRKQQFLFWVLSAY